MTFVTGARLLSGILTPRQAGEAYAAIADATVALSLEAESAGSPWTTARCPRDAAASWRWAASDPGSSARNPTSTSSFLYDFDPENRTSDGRRPLDAVVAYNRLAQRVFAALTTATRRGRLYAVDLRLRPYGSHSPPAVQLSGFAAYHGGEAELWEHMALARARVVAGDATLAADVTAAIARVLRQPRETAAVCAEAGAMRALVRPGAGPCRPLRPEARTGRAVRPRLPAQALVLSRARDWRPGCIGLGAEAVPGGGGARPPARGNGRGPRRTYGFLDAVYQWQRLVMTDPAAEPSETAARQIAKAVGLPDARSLARSCAATGAGARPCWRGSGGLCGCRAPRMSRRSTADGAVPARQAGRTPGRHGRHCRRARAFRVASGGTMTSATTISEPERERIAAALAEIACAAGEILRRYHRAPCPHALKPDGSPSSAADTEAEDLIVEALAGRFPGIAVVAEERAQTDATRPADLFFLVDPLDGTRDFLAGTPDYSVNIALVSGARPVAAALAAPGLGRVWWAGAATVEGAVVAGRPGAGRPVHTRPAPEAGLVALGSRRHGDPETAACLAALPVLETRQVGSALKFGLIAAGEADIYVRCGPTMEWDTAAGDHIVAAAGAAWWCPAVARSATGSTGPIIATGPSRPWAIPPWPRASPCRPAGRRGRSARRIHRRDVLQGTQGRPRRLRLPDQVGLGQEPGAALGIPEQVEALADHREDQGIGIHQPALEDSGSVVAPEARGVDRRIVPEGLAVGAAGEAPDPAVPGQFEPGRPACGPPSRK